MQAMCYLWKWESISVCWWIKTHLQRELSVTLPMWKSYSLVRIKMTWKEKKKCDKKTLEFPEALTNYWWMYVTIFWVVVAVWCYVDSWANNRCIHVYFCTLLSLISNHFCNVSLIHFPLVNLFVDFGLWRVLEPLIFPNNFFSPDLWLA